MYASQTTLYPQISHVDSYELKHKQLDVFDTYTIFIRSNTWACLGSSYSGKKRWFARQLTICHSCEIYHLFSKNFNYLLSRTYKFFLSSLKPATLHTGVVWSFAFLCWARSLFTMVLASMQSGCWVTSPRTSLRSPRQWNYERAPIVPHYLILHPWSCC